MQHTAFGISDKAVIGSAVELGENVRIAPFAVIGSDSGHVKIGSNCVIEPHTLVESGSWIGNGCLIDAYCRVCFGAEIGDETQVLYGSTVFENVVVGKRCIIGGNVSDRTVIEDFVTYFGEIAHDYRVAGNIADWDGGEDRPSPVIRSRSVVGQNALLIGGIEIGPGAYISAGEVVRCDVGEGMLYLRDKLYPLARFKGLIQARTDR